MKVKHPSATDGSKPRPAPSRIGQSPSRRLKRWAAAIKTDLHALWLAARDARTPRYLKLLALSVAAYAFSPIDLIPDFIPVIGYLDDLVLVPLGVLLVIRLMPPALMAEFRALASRAPKRPVSRIAAGVFVAIWLTLGLWLLVSLKP